MKDKIWFCELVHKALDKDIPVIIFDAKENGMGLQIGDVKFDGFGWEAFEDPVEDEDMDKALRLIELLELKK